MENDLFFTEEEIKVDERMGYPKAYAKLCRDGDFVPFSHGPPFTFTPYVLGNQEDSRVQDLDGLFPIIDPMAKPMTKPKIFVSLLWKQLNHLGNAGFDPEIIRVDPYGNVLYYHADAASPLAWDIDHWFPCSRGGLTVPSNLRILQWQVCKRKHNKLEFLIPWWDFQVGISINQFISIFASANSDFRRRAFSWFFSEGESQELNASQTVDCHIFPQHFLEAERRLGLAPAAVVLSRKEHFDAPLRSLDINRNPRSSTPIVAMQKTKQSLKENEDPIMAANPHQAIAIARDSLRQREAASKMQSEILKLDNEVSELQQKTEEEKLSIQELEIILMKKRRRAEKCRRLAESQCSYRTMLEKMIRDAMHQSIVYKEQVRLNQAAASALFARLEAQKALCDSAEREHLKKSKQRDELEKQILPESRQLRKRSRMDDALSEENALCLPGSEPNMRQVNEMEKHSLAENGANNTLYLPQVRSEHKELRKFLEEEQRAPEKQLLRSEKREEEEAEGEVEINNKITVLRPGVDKTEVEHAGEKGSWYISEEKVEKLEIEEGGKLYYIQFSFHQEPNIEEDEESRRERSKGNVEKWLQFLQESTQEEEEENERNRSEDLIKKLNLIYPQRGVKVSRAEEVQCTDNVEEAEKSPEQPASSYRNGNKAQVENGNETPSRRTLLKTPPYRIVTEKVKGAGRMDSPDDRIRTNQISNKGELLRSESARAFRRIPSSPSLIFEGMKKRVDCLGKKPLVLDDNNVDANHDVSRKGFIRSSLKAMKRVLTN